MQLKLPSKGQVVALLIGVPLGWLALWIGAALAAKALGIPFASASDPLGLFATLGGIMGAIFAVGGLVIALVAVLTQLQLQDRVTQVLTQAQKDLEDKFNRELRPTYEKEAQKQIEGTLAFFQATLAGDWRSAERLMLEALDKYPKLQGARSTLGLRMAKEVETYFSNQLHHATQSTATLYSSSSRGVPLVSGLTDVPLITTNDDAIIFDPYTIPARPFFAPTLRVSSGPPKMEAVDWLRKALEHGDDPDGRVSVTLPLMYGVIEWYDKMIDALNAADAASELNNNYFLMTDHLAMLVYACGNNIARLKELGEALIYDLPVSEEEVLATTEGQDWSKSEYIDWHALERPQIAQSDSRFPATVRIFVLKNAQGHTESFAYVFPHVGKQVTIPSDAPDAANHPPRWPVDKLVSELYKRYIFIQATALRLKQIR